MTQFAIAFPGQGSQSVGMLAELAEQHAVIKETFAEASQVLGYDLFALVMEGPAEELNKTWRTQPALLTASVALWRLWQQQGGAAPAVMAGHSLGEYSALVCSGALAFTDAVKLVELRGLAMQEAVPEGTGAMAAIIGLDNDAIAANCEKAAEGQVVSPVNFNSPGQVVIAGHKEAVERANVLMKESGAKRALPLPVSVPSHCALMKPAAENWPLRWTRSRSRFRASRSSIMSTYPANRIRSPSNKPWCVSCSARYVGPRLWSGWPMRGSPSRSRWVRARY